jgi:hypothetical protein
VKIRDFQIVSDDLRGNDKRRPLKYGPIIDLLIEGKTLQVAEPVLKITGTFGRHVRARGYQLHTHKTPEGTVFWATKLESLPPLPPPNPSLMGTVQKGAEDD